MLSNCWIQGKQYDKSPTHKRVKTVFNYQTKGRLNTLTSDIVGTKPSIEKSKLGERKESNLTNLSDLDHILRFSKFSLNASPNKIYKSMYEEKAPSAHHRRGSGGCTMSLNSTISKKKPM